EDGIRDYKVTGVQTCALPIYLRQVRCEIHSCRRYTQLLQTLEQARLWEHDGPSCPFHSNHLGNAIRTSGWEEDQYQTFLIGASGTRKEGLTACVSIGGDFLLDEDCSPVKSHRAVSRSDIEGARGELTFLPNHLDGE